MHLSCYMRRTIASIIKVGFEKMKPASDLRDAYMSGVYGRHPSVCFRGTDSPIDHVKYFVVGDVFGGCFSWMTSHCFLKASCAKQEKGEKSVLLESV